MEGEPLVCFKCLWISLKMVWMGHVQSLPWAPNLSFQRREVLIYSEMQQEDMAGRIVPKQHFNGCSELNMLNISCHPRNPNLEVATASRLLS